MCFAPKRVLGARAAVRYAARAGERFQHGIPHFLETQSMGKGNNSQKNDKKNKKPKQDKTKTVVKK